MSKKFATNPGPKPAKKKNAGAQIPLAPDAQAAVNSESNMDATATDGAQGALAGPGNPEGNPAPVEKEKQMATETVTLTRRTKARKNDKLVIFELAGRPELSVQFHRNAFPETIPETISVVADLAEAKTPKVKETKEERKARLAALPKLTLEQKLAAQEKKAAALREKIAKAAAAKTEAPTGEQPTA